jgi:hypothetical protein
MLGETIEVNSYFDTLAIVHEKNEEYDVLIDFHDRKKWIASNHITLTLIRPEDNPFVFEHMGNRRGRERYGRYILNKDGSVAYTYDIRGRYDYIPRKYLKGGINNGEPSVHLEGYAMSRNDYILLHNHNKETLIDNGKNKEDYDCPYVDTFDEDKREVVTLVPIRRNNRKVGMFKKGAKVCSYYFELKNRNDGGIDLYDTEGVLRYVCNIGKRYEYYRIGKFDKHLSTIEWWNDDTLIELIPDKTKKRIVVTTGIDPKNNPYLVRPRGDGGVDLVSKKDNTLKYICNIGKRFYYIPHEKHL